MTAFSASRRHAPVVVLLGLALEERRAAGKASVSSRSLTATGRASASSAASIAFSPRTRSTTAGQEAAASSRSSGGADAGSGAGSGSGVGSAGRSAGPCAQRSERARAAGAARRPPPGWARAIFKPLDPRQQRRHRRVELGRGGLDQHELELDPRLGAVRGRVERRRDQVEQPDRVGLGQRGGLLGEAVVALGGDPQLGRDLAEHLDRQQLAAVDLEVAQHLAGVAARVGEPRRRAQRARPDRGR